VGDIINKKREYKNEWKRVVKALERESEV